MVLAVCRRLLPDAAEAEDAMQQTFVSAYRSLLAGSEPRQAAGWLAAIARNECLDRIRARMREPLAEHGRNGGSEAPDTLAAVIAGEELRTLSRSIEQLPAQQREALLLHEFYGLPYGDVAAAIGVSESAIGSLLFRARRSLRSAFSRGYAVLPLPELWNGVTQLVSRGPAIKVAALPVVAKVGCGAVAVGLTAGAVVAVEHEVGTKAGPRSLQAQVPAVSGTPAEVRTRGPSDRLVVARLPVRESASALAATTTSERARRSSSPKPKHRTHPVPVAPAARPAPAHESAAPAPPAESPPADTPSPRGTERSNSVPGHGRSQHASTRSGRVVKRHDHGKSSARTPPAKKSEKAKASQPGPVAGKERPGPASTEPSSPAATPPGSAQVQEEQGPPDDGETADASTPSPDATPSSSKVHPDHPDRPVKS
jgi:RNA polymerase sigma-70 factor (ECF subfamily)